jgi:hypothetical protein
MKTELKVDPGFKEKTIPLITGMFLFMGVILFLKPFITKTIKLNEEVNEQKVELSKLREKENL